jgi:hypothetical protein
VDMNKYIPAQADVNPIKISTFNNILVVSWRAVFLEETSVARNCKLFHIMLYLAQL